MAVQLCQHRKHLCTRALQRCARCIDGRPSRPASDAAATGGAPPGGLAAAGLALGAGRRIVCTTSVVQGSTE